MNTSRGRCFRLNFKVDAETIRYFANEKKLAKVIQGAGYPDLATEITNGLDLDAPCRVTLKNSANGAIEQVDKVFPPGRYENGEQHTTRWHRFCRPTAPPRPLPRMRPEVPRMPGAVALAAAPDYPKDAERIRRRCLKRRIDVPSYSAGQTNS